MQHGLLSNIFENEPRSSTLASAQLGYISRLGLRVKSPFTIVRASREGICPDHAGVYIEITAVAATPQHRTQFVCEFRHFIWTLGVWGWFGLVQGNGSLYAGFSVIE